jgi:hypothetical protein
MSKIKIVIFDDENEDAKRVAFCLTEYWDRIRAGTRHVPEIDCQTVNDEAVARGMLATANHGIQVFVCDILVPDKNGVPQMHGLSLISKAKTAPAIPVVVAMTKGPATPQAGDFYGRIEKAGADLVYEKGPFVSAIGFEMTEEIVRKLEVAGQLLYRGQVHKEAGSEASAALESAFERIGEANLSAIANYFCFNSTAHNVWLSSLKPGLSGADVLLARYSSNDVDLSKKGVLLKISNDTKALQKEYDLYDKELKTNQSFSSRLIVDFVNISQPFIVNGWRALGGQFEHDASTLIRWLVRATPEPQAVEAVLADLFLAGGLSETYIATRKKLDGEPITAIRSKMLTSHRKARIQSSLDELSPLIQKYFPTDMSLVELLLDQGELGRVKRGSIVQRCNSSLQHGDLHASNILIATSGSKHRPKIIDYANISMLPWPLDIVRTLVDIAVSGIDAGVEGHEWTSLSGWRRITDVLTLSTAALDTAPIAESERTAPWVALRWMCSNVFKIAGLDGEPQAQADYQLALGIELMRAAYRKEELPTPKRAFGLAAAATALAKAEAEYSAMSRE